MSHEILVLYYSPGGTTAEMANIIARGVEEVEGMRSRVRTVPQVSAVSEQTADTIPENGPLYATVNDLVECDGLILGCPTHFGNMPAAMKHFIDSTSALWMGGKLAGKPAAVFSASSPAEKFQPICHLERPGDMCCQTSFACLSALPM